MGRWPVPVPQRRYAGTWSCVESKKKEHKLTKDQDDQLKESRRTKEGLFTCHTLVTRADSRRKTAKIGNSPATLARPLVSALLPLRLADRDGNGFPSSRGGASSQRVPGLVGTGSAGVRMTRAVAARDRICRRAA